VLRREAGEARHRGDLERAEVLERAADTIGQRVERTARSYTSVRGAMPAGRARTEAMDEIIAAAQADARTIDLDADEVLSRLWTGSPGARVWALGVLQARPDLASTRAVLEAVSRPDEMFDQYHALVLANQFVQLPTTHAQARKRVAGAVELQRDSGALGRDKPSIDMAAAVIDNAGRYP
jgi:hypothetical protein